MRPCNGFTLVEVLVAIVVVAVGVLGLAATAGHVTRMLARGRRAESAALFAQQRLERARLAACSPALRLPGAETLRRAGTVVARNTWSFTEWAGGAGVRIRVVTDHVVAPGRARADTLDTKVPCGR